MNFLEEIYQENILDVSSPLKELVLSLFSFLDSSFSNLLDINSQYFYSGLIQIDLIMTNSNQLKTWHSNRLDLLERESVQLTDFYILKQPCS